MYKEPKEDAGELMPVEGKDKVYDDIMAEIQELEGDLDEELKKFEKKIGYGSSLPMLPQKSHPPPLGVRSLTGIARRETRFVLSKPAMRYSNRVPATGDLPGSDEA